MGVQEAMSAACWQFFKVRPCNFPVRRLASMSYLVSRHKQRGLFRGLVAIIGEASPVDAGRSLESGLLVNATGYWAEHFDFGTRSHTLSRSLLGKQRAAEIIVNVLLPFTYAWGRYISHPALEGTALELFRRYPCMPANSLERHMRAQLGIDGKFVISARRQQGLIHIYKTFCIEGRCSDCPLG